MKARIDMKPGNYLAPVPVTLVSSALQGERPNALAIAWNGTVNSKPPMLSISVSPERYSFHLIKESGEFVVNLPDRKLARALDYCGVKSGRDTDKFLECKMTPEAMPELDFAPAIKEAPVSLGCKLRQEIPLGSHELFIGEIVSVRLREELLDAKGALDLRKAGLISYVHGQYYEIGDWIGFFGWSVARPSVRKRRRRP